jgi:hypothetical protein
MKTLITNPVTKFTQIWLCTMLILVGGCVTKPRPDPLEGWKLSWRQDPTLVNKAIRDDYEDYIQKLPAKERRFVSESSIRFFENTTGQRAVRISIPLPGFWSGIWWDHILIYDTKNKRIKVLKYKSGRYLS